jgi:hypothetical protein
MICAEVDVGCVGSWQEHNMARGTIFNDRTTSSLKDDSLDRHFFDRPYDNEFFMVYSLAPLDLLS